MSISAKEAAELVGMSKAGILKAIKTGKVSAAKNLKGEWRIEPVELFRVYTPVSTNETNQVGASPQPSVDKVHTDTDKSLQREVDLLRDMVTDLRSRLDAEVEERKKLTMLLTATTPQKRSWWSRLLNRGG